MPINSTDISRKRIREKAAELLLGFLTDDVQQLYDYTPLKFQGASPVVYMSSSSSARGFVGRQNLVLTSCRINVHTAVLQVADGWTEQDAEDMLDTLEHKIALFVQQMQVVDDYWDYISYAEPTNADEPIIVEGVPYLHEAISLEFGVF